jgi:hypothetical protein
MPSLATISNSSWTIFRKASGCSVNIQNALTAKEFLNILARLGGCMLPLAVPKTTMRPKGRCGVNIPVDKITPTPPAVA